MNLQTKKSLDGFGSGHYHGSRHVLGTIGRLKGFLQIVHQRSSHIDSEIRTHDLL